MLACACGSKLVIYNVNRGDVVSCCRGHKHDPPILSVSFGRHAQTGTLLLAVASGYADMGLVEIMSGVENMDDLSVDDLAYMPDLPCDLGWTHCVSFSTKQREGLLALGSGDGSVIVMDTLGIMSPLNAARTSLVFTVR